MGVIILSAMLCCSLNAFALTDGDWEFQLLDDEVMITRYLGSDEDVVMPSYIYGLPVTSLDKNFRLYNVATPVKSVVFPDGIKSIKGYFLGSDKLEKVVLPEGLERIEVRAFEYCINLKSINIPNSVNYIGSGAFKECSNLKEINIPDDAYIEYEAFAKTGLTSIDMTGKKVRMDQLVFYGCKNLKSIVFSENTKVIPRGTCAWCTALENVTLPNIETIDEYAFTGCTSIKEFILPTSLKKIVGGWDGFPLEEIVIPYGCESVGTPYCDFFIENSPNLKAIYIPDTVTMSSTGSFLSNCPNAIVYCNANSKAAEYCKKNKTSYLTDTSVNSGVHVYYNGKRISFHSYGQNPEISEGRTLVPLRSVFEAMGAKVEWDDAAKSAVARRGNVEVKIQIGANEIYKNGEAIALDVPARIMNDRAMVPARVIAEAFGAEVEWNNNGRAVLITE